MVRNHVRLILIQVTILVSGSQGQQSLKNKDGAPTTLPRTKFSNPSAGCYPPYGAYPYQYPGYGYGYQFAYPPQQSQEYYLGPMNAAQVRYLIAYIQSLMRYGNTTITAPQIPSTPTLYQSSSSSTPTVPPSVPTLNTSSEPTSTTASTNNSFEGSPSPTLNESSEPSTSTPIPPAFSTPGVSQSTPPISVPQIISTLLLNNTADKSVSNSVDQSIAAPLSPLSESRGDSVLRSAQAQFDNPFVSNFAYPAESGSDWLYSYNPAVASFYGNLPPCQPFYPPGFGPRNPFVLSPPAPLPASQPNATRRGNSTSAQSRQVSAFEAPTADDTAGGGGGVLTNVEDLPPQVKEFIRMIPDILSMPETSQLNPSNNNAIVHRIGGGLNGAEMGVRQFGGGSARVTPVAPNPYDQHNLQRFKKRRMKILRRHGYNNCYGK